MYNNGAAAAAAAASSPNGWNNSQVNKQQETRTAIPLSKLLLPFQNDFGHCDNTNNNDKKTTTTTTRLSTLQVASTTQKNDNPDEDESMEVNEYTIMDWNMDTTTVDLKNFVPTTLSSLLGHENYSNNRRLEANRILSRPNGVANTGTIVTTIQSSRLSSHGTSDGDFASHTLATLGYVDHRFHDDNKHNDNNDNETVADVSVRWHNRGGIQCHSESNDDDQHDA